MTTRRNRRVLMFREAFPTRPGSSRIVRLCACAVEKSIWPPCVGADAWMSRRRRICTEGRSSAWRKGVSIDVPGSREIKSWAYLAERRRSRAWSVPRPDMCVARSEKKPKCARTPDARRRNERRDRCWRASWLARGAVAMDMDLAGDSPAGGGGPHAGEKIPIVVEVCMRSTSTARQDDVRDAIEVYLEDLGSVIYAEGPLAMPSAEDDPYLHAHVESARVTDIGT